MDYGKISVNQIIDAVNMLTLTEYSELASMFSSLKHPAENIEILMPRFIMTRK